MYSLREIIVNMFSFISTDGNTEPYNLSVTELRQQIYGMLLGD